ncbi:hypothetical protein [Halalkaliarchaeum desulfuricum]|nr:hypothetical protein [Halalkaliarchaeum desulfuricum]
MGVPAPDIPEELLDGWRRIEKREEKPFRAGPISVRAHTVVYEDAERRERLREAIGPEVDTIWRFYFASRVRIRPRISSSVALTRIVESNATAAFREELRTRGFQSVERRDRRTLDVGGRIAPTFRFVAVVSAVSMAVASEAFLAVVPGDREYQLVGGAYPTSVIDGDSGDNNSGNTSDDTTEDSKSAIEAFLQPESDREELIRLIRTARGHPDR